MCERVRRCVESSSICTCTFVALTVIKVHYFTLYCCFYYFDWLALKTPSHLCLPSFPVASGNKAVNLRDINPLDAVVCACVVYVLCGCVCDVRRVLDGV